MLQASSETTTSRRSLLAAATGAAALVAGRAVALASDPIFAAIDKHRAAAATYGRVMEASDDDRMGEADKRRHAAAEAYDDLAWKLVKIAPATHAGTVALAAYCLECLQADIAPPDDGGHNYGANDDVWLHAVLRAIAAGLGA